MDFSNNNNNKNLTSREVQDLCRPRRKPARSRRSHGASSIVSPGQTVIGRTGRVNSDSGNFSHICIVPKESPQHPEKGTSAAVARNPIFSQTLSFGQEVEKNMDAFRSQMVTPTASLANLTSGTTFAAKARAAELNAVRTRRAAAQEAEADHEVPLGQPASLGAVKLVMPRNRGAKAWKPLNLDELPEHAIEEEEQTANRPSTAQSQATDQGFGGEQQPVENKRTLNFDNRATSHLAPRINPGPFADQHQRSYCPPFVEQCAARQYSTEWNPDMPVFNPSQNPASMYSTERPPACAGNQYGYQHNWRHATAQSQVNQPNNMFQPTMKHMSDDDPFMEQPKMNTQPSSFTKFASKPSGLHDSTAVHNQPAPVKGAMDVNFRFPPTASANLGTPTSASLAQPKAAPKVSLPPAPQRQSNPSGGTYTRDPKPYTSFSTTASKKEMLLQNLEQVVESSKAKGDLPNATRTVLYDPFAPETGDQSRYPSTSGKQSEGGKDFLKISEPEAYQTAAVMTSPFAYDFEESQAPQFPPGLCKGNEYVYSLAQPPEPVKRSPEDLQTWWSNDTRAQTIPRATMEELANTRFANDPPGYRSTSDSFGSLASPASTKTGASLAPIGSERFGRAMGSESSANADNDLTEVMKSVCINLVSYVVPSEKSQDDYLGQCRFAQVPEWCIDKSPNGNDSFFGDWGVPPSRVGRDPRYRPTLHEGRYTVFAEMQPGSSRDAGLGRRYH